MKTYLYVMLVTCLIINPSYSQIHEGQKIVLIEDGNCDNNPWVLFFEDNFNSTSLDFSKWEIPYQGVIRDFIHQNEKQWYANTGNTPSLPYDNNIEVSNGTLKLITRKETNPIIGSYTEWTASPPANYISTFEYTSAEIDSKESFGYGKYEIRCKIPKGKGFWPAFWMYGEGINNRNNEIDVFEFWDNNSSDHNMTVHYDGSMCHSDYNGPDYSKNFHIFTIVWDNYKIEWYVDGQLKRRSTKFYTLLGQPVDCNSAKAFQPYIMNEVFPRDNMQIIVNLAIQNNANYRPDDSTDFPSVLEIDYIKYYKKNP